MEEEWQDAPAAPAVFEGPLQVLSRASGKYVPRHCSIVEQYMYIYADPMNADDAPLSRVFLQALTVTNSSEHPLGFSLITDTQVKSRFLALSVDDKRQWVTSIHNAISNSTSTSVLQRVASKRRLTIRGSTTNVVVDRSLAAQCQGKLEKRQGFGSYKLRWCEMRAGVGLAYSKFQSSSDDSFKIIQLNPFNFSTTPEKMRFVLVNTDGTEFFFRCKSMPEFDYWCQAIQNEIAAQMQQQGSGADSSSAIAAAAAEKKSNRSEKESVVSLITSRPTSPSTSGPPSGLMDPEVMMEIADLESDKSVVPNRFHGNRSPAGGSSLAGGIDLLNMPPVQLESVCATYRPSKDTPGVREEVNRHLESCVTYGLPAMVCRLHERMLMPIVEPFPAVNEHINLLDLDIAQLRKAFLELLQKFGQEVCLHDVVLTIDRTLRIYTHVRERLLVRKNIAAFREQKDHFGLKQGVNGTLHFVHLLIKQERGAPSLENWNRVRVLVVALLECLSAFRLDYDVYDESLRTVLDIEQTVQDAHDWLVVHESIVR